MWVRECVCVVGEVGGGGGGVRRGGDENRCTTYVSIRIHRKNCMLTHIQTESQNTPMTDSTENAPTPKFQNRTTQIPRYQFRLDQIFDLNLYREIPRIWVSRFGGSLGCSIFIGNCHSRLIKSTSSSFNQTHRINCAIQDTELRNAVVGSSERAKTRL